jgi:DNA processing protein
MGVPGPVTSATSQGVHQMIRARNALLVTDGAEVLEAVSSSGEHLSIRRHGPAQPRDSLDMDHLQVLDAVPVSRGASTEQIARTAGLAPANVALALEALESAGLVETSVGRWRLRASKS